MLCYSYVCYVKGLSCILFEFIRSVIILNRQILESKGLNQFIQNILSFVCEIFCSISFVIIKIFTNFIFILGLLNLKRIRPLYTEHSQVNKAISVVELFYIGKERDRKKTRERQGIWNMGGNIVVPTSSHTDA